MFNFLKSKQDTPAINPVIAKVETLEPPETYQDIRPQWKVLAAKKEITSSDMAALHCYRALVKNEGKEGAIARLKKSFRPIHSSIKLSNGATPYQSLTISLQSLKYS